MIKRLTFEKQAPDLATAETIAALEAQIGFRFPPTFVEFCSRWNGGFPNKENEFYRVPYSFNQFYEEYGNQTKGISVSSLLGITEGLKQCSWIKSYNLINEIGRLGIIPIGDDLFGNQTVLRCDSPTGLVYWWDHDMPWELPEIPNPLGNVARSPRLIPIAQDLEYFYNSLTFDPDRPSDTSNLFYDKATSFWKASARPCHAGNDRRDCLTPKRIRKSQWKFGNSCLKDRLLFSLLFPLSVFEKAE